MKKLFLALPFLLAGCQSGRVAFQFQPVAPTSNTAPIGRPMTAVSATTDPVAVKAATATAAEPDQPAARRGTSQPSAGQQAAAPVPARQAVAVPAALAGEAPSTLAPVRPHPLRSLALRQLVRQRATAGPAHTAENGLGNIALFFIAVVLGILAGLGALVSVIFGTGFFTGVGFAAAGLLVLFLLYSLLSGGKKKKVPAPGS